MRVFVTGASGFIGSAVVKELISAGHSVLGLARSDASAKAITALGAEVQRGALEDLDSLRRGAASAEGVIHAGFIHDFSNFAVSCQTDKAAIEALGTALEGTGRPLIASAGILGLAAETDTPSGTFPRKSEETVLAQAEKGVRAMVMRLPPSVHGVGDHGFVPALIRVAREQRFAMYVGAGQNRWSAVHVLDAARLFRLALEQGTSGARLHCVADRGIPIKQLAELIGQRLAVPALSRSEEEATRLLGFVGHVLALDAGSSSARTQETLAWRPTQPGLIADLEGGHYFTT